MSSQELETSFAMCHTVQLQMGKKQELELRVRFEIVLLWGMGEGENAPMCHGEDKLERWTFPISNLSSRNLLVAGSSLWSRPFKWATCRYSCIIYSIWIDHFYCLLLVFFSLHMMSHLKTHYQWCSALLLSWFALKSDTSRNPDCKSTFMTQVFSFSSKNLQELWWTTSLYYGYYCAGWHTLQASWVANLRGSDFHHTNTGKKYQPMLAAGFLQNKLTSEFSPRLQSWILGRNNIDKLCSCLFRTDASLWSFWWAWNDMDNS